MAYQPAFEPAQVGYLDFETRSPTLDLRQVGAYRYATEAEAIVLSYAIGPDAEPAVYDFKSGPLTWARAPDAVKRHHDRVMAGEAIWAAWNAGFDRAVWNYSTLDFPEMRPAHIIDVMAQATAAGLPPDLAQASRLAHGAVKLTSGRDLIKLFCLPGCGGDPWRHQQEWQNFLNYACADVAALRDLFRRTLQLPAREWEEYFAMDHINERGARVDLAMVRQAAALAREDRARSAEELYKITLGAVASVDEVANMVQWLLRVLPADIVSDTLIKRPEEVDDDGNVTRPAKHHLTRKQVRQLIVDVTAALAGGEGGSAPALRDALRLLEIRLYGGSKTPQKFLRIEQQVIDDVLFGQYVFGGAGQTGRASSRGAQVHNLARDTLPYEHQAIAALLAGADYSTMAALGDGAPVSRKLSLLIRPAFVPALGNLFVWSDWSQIEARILPWLAGDETRLNVFREVDADPSKPDLYTRAAAALSGIDISEVTPPIRQRGKVAELALGFGGGANALRSMATAYNMHLSIEEAAPIVARWRENNQWCVAFWDEVYGAVIAAMRNPGMERPAGRVTYCYLPRYFGGSLICTLPSGRALTYRQIKYENVPDLDDEDRVVGYSTHLRCARGYGRIKLWRGMFVENIVQATAADFLRGTLVRLVKAGYDVRLHTHDEILIEASERDALWIRNELRKFMCGGFPWSHGLPLASEETVAAYYTKDKSAYETVQGLEALSAAHCDASVLPG